MIKVDWSKAPEGATHVNGAGVFQRENNDGSVSEHDEGCWRRTSKRIADFNPNYIKARPITWTGGLPPVGTVCEFYTAPDKWHRVEVVAHLENENGSASAVFKYLDRKGWRACAFPGEFRPIRTPEQIAEEEQSYRKMNKELQEYKNLLEFYLKELDNEMCCPFGMDPNTEGKLWRKAKQECLVWCIEMLPEIKGDH